MNTQNYSSSYMAYVVDLGFLERLARDYKAGALKLKDNKFNQCTPSFHLLSSLAFELFPKVLIGYKVCVKHKDNKIISEDEIISEVQNEIKKYGHNISKLYNDLPELMDLLNINKIERNQTGYVWEYVVTLNNTNKHIAIKDLEAVRYGSFARNKDVMTLCVHDGELINLLNKIEKYVEDKNLETYNILNN